jgi:hypothetical protein
MAFFNTEVPILTRKPPVLEAPPSPEIWQVQWQLHSHLRWSSFYTRHDQACLIWGAITALIFSIAQFLPLSWTTQALIATSLTALGSLIMAGLTWHYTQVDRLAWILHTWLLLMILGTLLTNLSLWYSWNPILIALCPLWLGLCGIGYLITGLGMRSRLILLCSALHFLVLLLLPHIGRQILLTGLTISASVTALSELQWDSNGVCNYRTPKPPQNPQPSNSTPSPTAPTESASDFHSHPHQKTTHPSAHYK